MARFVLSCETLLRGAFLSRGFVVLFPAPPSAVPLEVIGLRLPCRPALGLTSSNRKKPGRSAPDAWKLVTQQIGVPDASPSGQSRFEPTERLIAARPLKVLKDKKGSDPPAVELVNCPSSLNNQPSSSWEGHNEDQRATAVMSHLVDVRVYQSYTWTYGAYATWRNCVDRGGRYRF